MATESPTFIILILSISILHQTSNLLISCNSDSIATTQFSLNEGPPNEQVSNFSNSTSTQDAATECDCDKLGTKYCEINRNNSSTTINSATCICHDNVTGTRCNKCAEGYYDPGLRGDSLRLDCVPCDCHVPGSKSKDCNNLTGQCNCKAGFKLKYCNECDVDHYQVIRNGSIECIPCDCHPIMSRETQIDELNEKKLLDGACDIKINATEKECSDRLMLNMTRHCDLVTGQCLCPPESIGLRCDRCAPRHAFSADLGRCFPCDTCSTSLIDFLDEVGQDLNYASRTMEKGRLSATIGFRIRELE